MRAGDAADLAEKVAWLRDNPRRGGAHGQRTRARSPSASSAATSSPRAPSACSRRPRADSSSPTAWSTRTGATTCSTASPRSGARTRRACRARAARARQRLRPTAPPRRCASATPRRACSRSSGGAGKADNDSLLLREARGRYCLLLNEDSELREGAARALLDALDADPAARPPRARSCSRARASRPPARGGCPTSLGRSRRRRSCTTASRCRARGAEVREVGWVQSSAMLVRRDAAEQVGWLDGDFFVYSDETDFCKRLRDAGWRILFVPGARAVHHDQLGTDTAAMRRRIVEFHRNRDRYFRKHGLRLTRLVWKAVLDLGLPRAGARRDGAARARPAPLPAPRPPGAVPGDAARASARPPRPTTGRLAPTDNVRARRWSTLTPPSWPQWAARSAPCWCCSRAAAAGASRCSPGSRCSRRQSWRSPGRSAAGRSTG